MRSLIWLLLKMWFSYKTPLIKTSQPSHSIFDWWFSWAQRRLRSTSFQYNIGCSTAILADDGYFMNRLLLNEMKFLNCETIMIHWFIHYWKWVHRKKCGNTSNGWCHSLSQSFEWLFIASQLVNKHTSEREYFQFQRIFFIFLLLKSHVMPKSLQFLFFAVVISVNWLQFYAKLSTNYIEMQINSIRWG